MGSLGEKKNPSGRKKLALSLGEKKKSYREKKNWTPKMTKIEKIEISGVATYHQTGPYNKESWPGIPCARPPNGHGRPLPAPSGRGLVPPGCRQCRIQGL